MVGGGKSHTVEPLRAKGQIYPKFRSSIANFIECYRVESTVESEQTIGDPAITRDVPIGERRCSLLEGGMKRGDGTVVLPGNGIARPRVFCGAPSISHTVNLGLLPDIGTAKLTSSPA